MSQALSVGGDAAAAITEIKDATSENDWVLLGYVPKTNTLKVEGKGDGGLEEFTEDLNDGKIQFGYVRFQIQQTTKFLYVSWCGDGVEGMRKGLFNNHAKDFENYLSAPGRGFHIQINARTTDDLDEKTVLDKLNKVSAFLKTTSLKGADKGQLKEQSNQFWQQEQKKDVERKEALATHAKEQQDMLAASKTAEQQRLAAQANSTLKEMEQHRAEEAAAFKAQEEERAAAQAKAREANSKRVLSEVNQRKLASYTPVDAAAGVKQTPAPVQAAPKPAAPAAATASAPKPAPVVKKAPGKLNTPSAFLGTQQQQQPPPAAHKPVGKLAPRVAAPAHTPAAAPAPVHTPAPKPAVPKPAPAPAPVNVPTPKPAVPKPAPAPAPVHVPAPAPVHVPPPAPVHVPAPAPPAPEPEPVYAEPEPAPPAPEEPAYTEDAHAHTYAHTEEQAYDPNAYDPNAYDPNAYGTEQTYDDPNAAYDPNAYDPNAYDPNAYATQEGGEQQAYAEGGEQQAYPQARAIYDFAAETETDLSFAEGDYINILDDTDPSGWWKGELNGAEGFFPSNFVERI